MLGSNVWSWVQQDCWIRLWRKLVDSSRFVFLKNVVYRAVSGMYCTGSSDIRRWLEDSKRPVKILKFNHSSGIEGNIKIHTLSVRLFAGARELMNQDHIEVVLTLPSNVRDLKRAITEQHESLASFVSFGRIAVNNDFASEETVIPLQQIALMVIALIPPVSGG